MIKTAVDEAAKKYWKLLYGDYGEDLVRDIPRRIKASLAKNSKIASVDTGVVLPTAHVTMSDGVKIEGMYRDSNKKLLFIATLNGSGSVTDIKTIDLV